MAAARGLHEIGYIVGEHFSAPRRSEYERNSVYAARTDLYHRQRLLDCHVLWQTKHMRSNKWAENLRLSLAKVTVEPNIQCAHSLRARNAPDIRR